MVEDRNAAKLADLTQPFGQVEVLARRRRIAGWVVVAKDDRRCSASDEGAKHVTWMDLDASEGASGNAGLEQQTVANVERQHPELLDWRGSQPGSVVCPDLGRIGQNPATLRPRPDHPAAKLQGGLNRRRPGWSNARQRAQFGLCAFGKAAQITGMGKQVMRDFDHVLPLAARAQEDCQELCIGQAARPSRQQALAGTVFGGKCKKGGHVLVQSMRRASGRPKRWRVFKSLGNFVASPEIVLL